MRETAVKRISFFFEILMLYEVHNLQIYSHFIYLSGGLRVKVGKVRMGKIMFPDKLSTNGTLDPKDFHHPKGFHLGTTTAELWQF